ncbi:MAG: IscS subfamily cysteine desulfurase [Proteobacteria bacterium]|nr:IscS subfamily cysteine desulfurase [Pseudomonadota bacterium]NDC23577.1 IscS subfamily cysteine desulfurase [Pseudomonadota bacterium]NDD03710.1 IscS subfamily cysteine desulfurase [Pseudomonadota bacterium]NDG26851.1 IscS subfamily cysteine desulfurase [Pseudomonadota bacterium]
MRLPIYLDNNSTTPIDLRVVEAMMPYLTEKFGNAASRSHAYGWECEEAVEKARAQIGKLIGAQAKEIAFTSGATESINIAIKGAFEMYGEKGNHVITCVTEHKATLDSAKYIEKHGANVTYLPVNSLGQINLEELKKAITPQTILISLMHANNEMGTIHPIEEIGKIAKEKGILFHVDAAQTAGKVPVDVAKMGIDILSLSGHKLYGPKGIGALYVRRNNPRVRLAPVIHGGGHERGLRSGTLNVPAIVGLGKAAEIAMMEMETEFKRVRELRNRLYRGITKELDEVYLNGHPEDRLPNNLNLSFAYVEGEALMMGFKELAVSSGSACTSASLEPSYVLKAMGVGEELAHTSIRFGLGRFTTPEEVDFAVEKVVATVKRLRDLSPLYEMAKEGIDLKQVQWNPH